MWVLAYHRDRATASDTYVADILSEMIIFYFIINSTFGWFALQGLDNDSGAFLWKLLSADILCTLKLNYYEMNRLNHMYINPSDMQIVPGK